MKIDMTHHGTGFAIVIALAGLGLFLVSVKLMSSSMKTMTSGYLSKSLSKMTKNKWMGLGFGIIFTTMIQSSDGTVALTIGLIGAGLLTLRGAIPLILGANIGTATTAIIVALGGANSAAFEFIQYFPVLVFIGSAGLLFVKEEKKVNIAYLIFAVGAIFLGLKIMSAGMKAITGQAWFHSVIKGVGHNTWTAFLSNTALTGVVQSSSATVTVVQGIFVIGGEQTNGIVPNAINNGMTLESAIAMVVGANIGTTFTALIASIGGKKDARRIAVVWLTSNLMMALLVLPLMKYYAEFISIMQPAKHVANGSSISYSELNRINTSMKFQLSWAHLIFNSTMVAIFIWLTNPLEKWANYVVKEKDSKFSYEVHLDYNLLNESTELAALSAQKSVSALGWMSEDAIKLMQEYIKSGDKKIYEDLKDLIQLVEATRTALFAYLVEIGSKDISKRTSNKQVAMVLATRSFERIPLIGKDLINEFRKIYKKGKLNIEGKEIVELEKLLKIVEKMTSKSSKQLSSYSSSRAKDIRELNEYLDGEVAKYSEAFVKSKKKYDFDYLLAVKYISRMGHHANSANKDRRRGRKESDINKISERLEKQITKELTFHQPGVVQK